MKLVTFNFASTAEDASLKQVKSCLKALTAANTGNNAITAPDAKSSISKQHSALSAKIEQQFKDLFVEDYSTGKDFEYEIELRPSATGIQRSARKIPIAIEKQVKDSFDHMLKHGIIRKVTQSTRFVSQLSCVTQKGKLQMCIDPQDLNNVIRRQHHPLKLFMLQRLLANTAC